MINDMWVHEKPNDAESLHEFLVEQKDELSRLATRPDRNFLQLIHKESRETVWSDLLAFFFDSGAEHGVGDAILVNGLHLCQDRIGKVKSVKREATTESGGHIDIVIETENFVIGIENKNHAPLRNDLNDYFEYLLLTAQGRTVKAFVMSAYDLSRELRSSGFEYLGYREFFSRIKSVEPLTMSDAYKPIWKAFRESVGLSIDGGVVMEHVKKQIEFLKLHNNSVRSILAMHHDVCIAMCDVLDRLKTRLQNWENLPVDVYIRCERRCWNGDELLKLVAEYKDGPSISLQITIMGNYEFKVHYWLSVSDVAPVTGDEMMFPYADDCEDKLMKYCRSKLPDLLRKLNMVSRAEKNEE